MMIQMLMGGGGTVVNPLPVTGIGDNQIDPAPAYAAVALGTDGSITMTGNASSGGPNWFSPTTTGIGTNYWARVTKNSGTNNTAGSALGSWISLAGALFWGWQKATMGTISADIDIDIATDALGANIVASKAGILVSVSSLP